MLTLHYLNESRSHRILWLLEELGLDYELVAHERDPKTQLAPRALRAIHPLGKAPVLVDGDRALAESGAIIERVLDRHDPDGALRPEPGGEAYERYRYWLHYAEGSAMPPIVLRKVFSELVRQSPLLARPVSSAIERMMRARYLDAELARHVRFWDAHLADHAWFAGDALSGADIQMSFALEAAGELQAIGSAPNVERWLEAIGRRPAYRRAVERAGGYAYAAPGGA